MRKKKAVGKALTFPFLKVNMVSSSAYSQDTDKIFLCFCEVPAFTFMH